MKQYQADLSLNREQRGLLLYLICVKENLSSLPWKDFLDAFLGLQSFL